MSGKTDATITITPEAPAGFDIVPGQTIPASVKAGTTGIPTVTVKVQHHKIVKTPNDQDLKNLGDMIPANPSKKPGDGTPNTAITHSGLVRDMTRTITINAPANHVGTTTNNMTL